MKIDAEPIGRQEAIDLYRQGCQPTVSKIVALSTEVTRLRAELTKCNAPAPTEQSTPSPTTPSGAIPPYQKPNSSPQKRRRRPGQKKGHPGMTRQRPDHIDETRTHFPPLHCPHCKGALDRKHHRIRERIIEGIKTAANEVVRHVIHGDYCPRCRKFVESPVLAAMPNDQISLYTFVLTAYLHYRMGLSVRHCEKLLEHCGLALSPGGLTQGWQRLATHLRPAYDQILERVQDSLVKMADETSWRIWGVTHWLWYFGSQYWSYYVIDRHRGTAVVNAVLGEVIEGILICDFWAAYNAIDAWAKQRCIFHLFTNIKKVDLHKARDPCWKSFRKTLVRLLRDAIRLAATENIDQPTFERRLARLHTRLDHLIACPGPDRDARRLAKRLGRHRDEIFTFLDYLPLVSPYNNHSEQQMRGPVICRRIGQGNRSLHGAQAQAILMSLFRSAELQNVDAVHYVMSLAQDSIAGRPVVLPFAPDEAELHEVA